jgi:hypothetical protein
MMLKVSSSNLIDLIKKNSRKKLAISILLDFRLCEKTFNTSVCYNDVNTLKGWCQFFKNKPDYQMSVCNQSVSHMGNSVSVSSDVGTKMTKKTKYQLDNLPVVCNLYTTTKCKKVIGKPFTVCKKVYSKTDGNWKILLVLEKTYIKNPRRKNVVNWDNNDIIYIEFHYMKPLTSFNQIQLTKLKSHLIKFLPNKISKTRGGLNESYNSSRNTKNYIIDIANKSMSPKHPFRYLGDIFVTPQLINRTDYFSLLNDMNGSVYCINNNYSGIEYMIVIDSSKSVVYYTTKSYTESDSVSTNHGLCIMSAVKHKDKYIIRRVIVVNGLMVKDTTIKQMNDRNKLFSDILNVNRVVYDTINNNNYKKSITKHKSNIKNGVDFIEISRIDLPFLKNNIHRWSSKQLPITFFCKECPPTYLKDYPTPPKNQLLYILFLTISYRDFKMSGIKTLPFHDEFFGDTANFTKPVQFSPSTFPNAFLFYSGVPDLNNQYISLVFDYKKKEWLFIEKASAEDTGAYGDDFRMIELNVWNSYRNPVAYSDLILDKSKISEQMYFVALKNKAHEAPIKMNNFGKISLINQYTNPGASVIDLASGRASDLMTYRYARVGDLLFCEIDKDAVDVTLQRKYKFENPNNTPLKIFNTNLNDPYKYNMTQIRDNYTHGKVSNVFCFFALHYLTDTIARIKNIATLISGLLSKGSKFVYTAFDGKSVIRLLDSNNGKWEVFEDSKKKYSIIAKYKNTDIGTPKRAIKLILPFNINTFYYDENLINDIILDKEFGKCGLTVDSEGSFMDFVDKFREKKPHFYNNLTDNDKIFVGLYKYKVFKKL